MLVADDFFFIAHTDRTGRGRLHPRAAGLGLSAGLLAELVLFGRVEICEGSVYVVRHDPPGDPLAHTILDQVIAQPQHREVRTWLAFLEQTATEWVGQRLARAGYVEAVERRRLLGRPRLMFVPTDANKAAWPQVRLARQLTSGERLGEPDAVLAGLVAVTGLMRHVLWNPDTHDAGLAHLRRVVAGLPPSLYGLIAHTEAAVGDAVLAPR